MKKKVATSIRVPSAKNADQPATRKMLWLVRDELKSEIRSLGIKTDSKFEEIKSQFKSQFGEVRSQFEEMKSEFFRMHTLLEEQNSNNRIVLGGLQALWQRQDRLEKHLPKSHL